jgi:hypothetical protein
VNYVEVERIASLVIAIANHLGRAYSASGPHRAATIHHGIECATKLGNGVVDERFVYLPERPRRRR